MASNHGQAHLRQAPVATSSRRTRSSNPVLPSVPTQSFSEILDRALGPLEAVEATTVEADEVHAPVAAAAGEPSTLLSSVPGENPDATIMLPSIICQAMLSTWNSHVIYVNDSRYCRRTRPSCLSGWRARCLSLDFARLASCAL